MSEVKGLKEILKEKDQELDNTHSLKLIVENEAKGNHENYLKIVEKV